MSTHYTSITIRLLLIYTGQKGLFKYAYCKQLPAQALSHFYRVFMHLLRALVHNPLCSITLVFLFLYDLTSACCQACNSKASDESARLQFWEPEVRIILKGGGRSWQKENKQLCKVSSERYQRIKR